MIKYTAVESGSSLWRKRDTNLEWEGEEEPYRVGFELVDIYFRKNVFPTSVH